MQKRKSPTQHKATVYPAPNLTPGYNSASQIHLTHKFFSFTRRTRDYFLWKNKSAKPKLSTESKFFNKNKNLFR